MKKCEMCSKGHNGEYGSGRFCSSFCARKFSTKNDRNKINEKLRIAAKLYCDLHPVVRKQSVTKACPVCGKIFNTYKSVDLTYCSKQCYLDDSNCKFRVKPKGGYREGSGRGKCGYYNGIWCQSTYELAYVIYNIDHGIKFQRNTERFKYIKDGEEKEYLPDFLENDSLIEVKGYYTPDVDLKANSVNKKIRVLYKNDLKYAFDYIKTKYGLPLLRLYDDYRPKFQYRCCSCGKDFSSDIRKKTDKVFCSRKCSGVNVSKIAHSL